MKNFPSTTDIRDRDLPTMKNLGHIRRKNREKEQPFTFVRLHPEPTHEPVFTSPASSEKMTPTPAILPPHLQVSTPRVSRFVECFIGEYIPSTLHPLSSNLKARKKRKEREKHPYLQPTQYRMIGKERRGEWDLSVCVVGRVRKREGGYGGEEMG